MSAAEPPQLCRRIRRARVRLAAISQEEAARRLGLSLKGYRAYETFREPSIRRLRQIARVFGLDEDYFIRGEDEPEPDAARFEQRIQAELLRIKDRLDRLERLLARGPSRPAQRRSGTR